MSFQDLVFIGVPALSIFLFGAGIVDLVIEALGVSVVHNAAADEWSTVAAASSFAPRVSAVSVVQPDLESDRLHIRRLSEMRSGDLEVVLVVRSPSASELAEWVDEFSLISLASDAAWEAPYIQQLYTSSGAVRLVVCQTGCSYEDALNAGLSMATAPWIAAVEMDACFSQDVLQRLLVSVLEDPDRVLAVGTLAPEPRPAALSGALLGLHRERKWLARCGLCSVGNVFTPALGAFWLLNRAALVTAKGVAGGLTQTVAIMFKEARAFGAPGRIVFVPDWPPSFAALGRQHNEFKLGPSRPKGQRPHESRKWLITHPSALSVLAVPAICYAHVAPIVKIVVLTLGAAGFIAGWLPPASLGMAIASTIGLDALMSLTAVLLCDVITPAEPAVR